VTGSEDFLDQSMALLGALVLDNGDRWGAVASETQRADALAILSESGPRRHWLGRARGYSKTSDVAALLLVLLLTLRPGSECVAAAADADQAGILVRRMRGLVTRTGVEDNFEMTSKRVTCKWTQSFVEVLPADGASAWGLAPAVVVLDEFPQWRDTENARELYDALVTALPKVPGSRLIIMGTAGDPAGWAAKVREEALADPENWRVSEPIGPPPWMSAAAVELERRHRLPSIFSRLFENRWTAPENRLTSMEELRAAVRLDGPQDYKPGVRYKIGVDLGLRHDRTAIAVVHGEDVEGTDAKRVVVDRMIVFEGTKANEVTLSDVEDTLFDTWQTYGRPRIRIDPWQGIGLAQRLRRRGVAVEEWSYSDRRYGAAAAALFNLLRDGLLDLYDHPALLDELATVRLRETSLPGVVRVDHEPGRHDDLCQALGFAVTALLERADGGGQFLLPEGMIPKAPIGRQYEPRGEPAVPVVREGEPRPTDRLTNFWTARRHAGFQPPRHRR